ncbi:MAG: diacylglycerol kinase family protein [Myxococcota bacterium]
MATPIGVLTNPNSGKNRRNPERLGDLERAVAGYGVVRQTRDLDELAGVIREFVELGCRYWVVDGGDGTLHWLLSTAHRVATEDDTTDAPWPMVVPANGGSIDFVAHKAGIRGQATDIVRELVAALERGESPSSVELDTLLITGDTLGGDVSFERIGFASAIGGVAQRFFDKLYQRDRVDAWGIMDVLAKASAGGVAGSTPRPLRDVLVPSLQQYADDLFEPTRAKVEVDGKPLEFDSFSSLQVGSIDINLGGVVRTFRHAAECGVMHAQAISSSRLGVVANLPNIVLGTKIWGRDVFDGPVQELSAEAVGSSTLDPVIDGELCFGLSRLRIRQGPKLRIPAVCSA